MAAGAGTAPMRYDGAAACPMMGRLMSWRSASDAMSGWDVHIPRAFSSSFSFRPAPSSRLFPICLLRLVPPPSGPGDARAYLSICGCWRLVGLLACHRPRAAHSAFARSLFLVGLRSGNSPVRCRLLRFLRRRGCRVSSLLPRLVVVASARRFGHRVILYSIPDDMGLITGSCGIRPVFACLPVIVSVPWGRCGIVSCGCRPVPRVVGRLASSSLLA